jgi:ABC-2 type transport system permease protein
MTDKIAQVGRSRSSPSAARVIWLVNRIAMRRWFNRLRAGGWRAARPQEGPVTAEGPRKATARKRPAQFLPLVLFGFFVIVVQVVFQTVSVIRRSASNDESLIGNSAMACLHWADAHPSSQWEDPEGNRKRTEYLRSCLERDSGDLFRVGDVDRNRVDRALERYETIGSQSFREAPSLFSLATTSQPWPGIDRAQPLLLVLIGIVILGLSLIGIGSADARQLEDDLSWLYQLPVKASVLLGARAIAASVLQPAAWVFGAPLLFVIARAHGYGAAAYGFGAWAAIQIGAIAGCAELVTPLALRRALSPSAVRTLQGASTLVGTLGLTIAFLIINRPDIGVHDVPRWLALLPASCLVALLDAKHLRGAMGGLALAWVVLPPIAAAAMGGAIVARGLVVTSGEASRRSQSGNARREGLRQRTAPAWWSRGITGKEVRWLLRDRRAFLMAVVFPLMMFAAQVFVRPGATANLLTLLSDVQRATTAGFVVASYGFAYSAANVLLAEGGALWILYTLPRPLMRTMLDKVTMWSCLGLAQLLLLSSVGLLHDRRWAEAPLYLAVAAGGVVIFAFIATALGALAADPLAPSGRAMGAGRIYLYMVLFSTFASALYRDSLYAKVTSLAFFSLLALALWQKVRDRAPYLLDPTARPPPSLEVSDAILIAVAFFIVQLVFAFVLIPFELGLFLTISAAFFFSGAVVATGATFVLKRAKVPNLTRTLGLGWPARPARFASGVAYAAALGLLLGVAARLYAKALGPALPIQISPGVREVLGDVRWFVATAVVGAPLFEELIFRGFLYGSLRRVWPRWAAALASAAAFAACHPPAAIAPVLLVGLAAAGLIEWSESLAAPIVLHTTYNAFVLWGVWSRLAN